MATIIILTVLAIVVGVAINVYLGVRVADAGLGLRISPTVAYAIPTGIDPALIRSELLKAGFTTGTDRVGNTERLLIECEREERDRVRTAIEGATLTGYDGSAATLGHVTFEDER